MTSFKFVHVSDIHYASRPKAANVLDFISATARAGLPPRTTPTTLLGQRSHCPDIALGLAKFLAFNLKDHHVIFASGDVATTGFNFDLKAAFDYINAAPTLKSLYKSVTGLPTLGVRRKIAVMPGNHDRFQDTLCTPNGSYFDQQFNQQWGSPLDRVKVFTLHDRQSGDRLHLIAADFCLTNAGQSSPPGWPACCGQGFVHTNVLRRLVTRTLAVREQEPNSGIVWASHFPPTKTTAGLFANADLKGYKDLLREAKSCNVSYILSGHIHRNGVFPEDGVTVLTVGSACCYLEKNGNWIRSLDFSLSGGQVDLRSIVDYSWDSNLKTFR